MADDVVRHGAVEVSRAAFSVVHGTIAQHARIHVSPTGWVQQDLVGGRKILKLFEILGHRARKGIKCIPLDQIGPPDIPGSHEQIAKTPSPIGNNAGLMLGVEGCLMKKLGADKATIGHQIFVSDLGVDCIGQLQGLGIPRVEKVQRQELGIFRSRDAVLNHWLEGLNLVLV